MPDLKITQQTDHVTPVLGTDLLPLVGNVALTPTNYRVQIKNFFSQVQIDLPQTNYSALKITASVTANANAAVQAAGEFGLVSNSSTSAVALDRYGLLVKNVIQNGNSNVTGQMAAAMFTLDSGNSATVNANTFGVIVRHFSNTAPRASAPRAYFAAMEDANTGAPTTYLMDIGAGGLVVSSNASANANVVFSPVGAASATHVLKLSVNGQDFWLLGSNVAPA